jgi:hypothetical protein
VFLDLIEEAIHTARRAEAAAHVAAARDCRLDQLSLRLRLVVLAGEAITGPGPTQPPSMRRSPTRATTAGPSTWPVSSSPTAPTCAA